MESGSSAGGNQPSDNKKSPGPEEKANQISKGQAIPSNKKKLENEQKPTGIATNESVDQKDKQPPTPTREPTTSDKSGYLQEIIREYEGPEPQNLNAATSCVRWVSSPATASKIIASANEAEFQSKASSVPGKENTSAQQSLAKILEIVREPEKEVKKEPIKITEKEEGIKTTSVDWDRPSPKDLAKARRKFPERKPLQQWVVVPDSGQDGKSLKKEELPMYVTLRERSKDNAATYLAMVIREYDPTDGTIDLSSYDPALNLPPTHSPKKDRSSRRKKRSQGKGSPRSRSPSSNESRSDGTSSGSEETD